MPTAMLTHDTDKIINLSDIRHVIRGSTVVSSTPLFSEFIPDIWIISLDRHKNLKSNALEQLKYDIALMKKKHPFLKIFLLRLENADDSEDYKAELQKLEVHKQFIVKKMDWEEFEEFIKKEDPEEEFEYCDKERFVHFDQKIWSAFINELSLCACIEDEFGVKKWLEMEGNIDPMQAVLKELPPESLLRAPLEHLQCQMSTLESGLVYSQLAEASLKFVNGLKGLGPNDNASALIEEYQRNCHNYLQEGTSSTTAQVIAGVIAAVIAAVVVMAIVLSAGYLLGWAFGAWACGEMFVAQWISGGLAAGIVAKSTEVAGAAIFAWGLYGLFSDNFPRAQIEEALDNVVDMANDIRLFAP